MRDSVVYDIAQITLPSSFHFSTSSIFLFIITLPTPDFLFFFFNDPATTEIYPLPLHAALPIWDPRKIEPRKIPRWKVSERLSECAAGSLRLLTVTTTCPCPARSESATSTVTRLGRVNAELSRAIVPTPCWPGARKFSTFRINVTRLFGSEPLSSTASSGNDRKTSRPV